MQIRNADTTTNFKPPTIKRKLYAKNARLKRKPKVCVVLPVCIVQSGLPFTLQDEAGSMSAVCS